ncbi:cytochrome c family protein [Hydrogenimonas sp.]|nr:cytochrome c family protein [Hydrogenimonas sp.]
MPDVMVRVCLTCHDGVNAPDIALFSESAPQKFNNNTASLSTDPISKDAFVHSHPVGKEYAPYSPGGNRASLRPESHILKDWIGAKTIQDLVSEGVVGCTSCHDPHTTNAQFLRTRNSDSKLCKGCHNK